MTLVVQVGRGPRRKKGSLIRIANRQQLREHDKRPLFGIENHADVQAAGLMWTYERCEHGVMGNGLYCSVCNPVNVTGKSRQVLGVSGAISRAFMADASNRSITISSAEPWAPWMRVCIRVGPNGAAYYHTGEAFSPEVSPVGKHILEAPETAETESKDPERQSWREPVAPNMTRRTKFDRRAYALIPDRDFSVYEDPAAAEQLSTLETRLSGGQLSYFEPTPKFREDWQPEMVRGSTDGPIYTSAGFRTKEQKEAEKAECKRTVIGHTKASVWWARGRGPSASTARKFLARDDSPFPVPASSAWPPFVMTTWTRRERPVVEDVVHRYDPGIRKPVKPRFVPERLHSRKITICPPMPASAQGAYTVPRKEDDFEYKTAWAGENVIRPRWEPRMLTFGEVHGMRTKIKGNR